MSTAAPSRAPRRLLTCLLALVLLPLAWVVVPASPAAAAEVYPVPASGSWAIEGAGWGHGRGLSQWGSQGAALQGLAPHQILDFYYPGTTIGDIPVQDIRVQLTSYSGPAVVFGRYGSEQLTVTDQTNGQTAALPTSAVRYRVTIDSSWMRIDLYDGSTWSPFALNGQTNITGPIDIKGPSGTWVYDPSLNGAGRQYWGTMRVVRTAPTTAQAVNVLDIQAYLKGVVPRESPSSFHGNALQAQAIAARSYAKSVSQSGQPWDICDTTQCQVYGGRFVAAAGGAITGLEAASTSTAVDATGGKVVREAGGAVAFTQFSASNGGYSVAGSKPYLVAKADPYSGSAPGDPVSRWTATLAATKVQEQCPSGGTLQSFEIVSRDGKGPYGGRITKLRVNCTTGSADVTSTSTLAFGMRHHMWRPTGATGTPGTALTRLSGADRYATAATIAKASFSTTDVALLARGDGPASFADGLAANFLGGVLQAPTLLTSIDSVPPPTLDALDQLDVKTIKLLGGTSAISAAVESSLESAGYTVDRIAGDDRFATAAAVARAGGAGSIGSQGGKKTAILSSGRAFPDALAAGGIVWGMKFPQLLTEVGSLPAATASALTDLGVQHVVITGGTTAVSAAVEDAVRALGITTERAAGATRFETGVILGDLSIDRYGFAATHVDIATGESFPDALTGGPHAGKSRTATILTAGNSVPDAPCNFLQRRRTTITSGHVYGGTSAVTDSARSALEGCLAS